MLSGSLRLVQTVRCGDLGIGSVPADPWGTADAAGTVVRIEYYAAMEIRRVLSIALGVFAGLLVYTVVISLADSRYLALPVKTRIEKGLSDAAEAKRQEEKAVEEDRRRRQEVEDAGKTLYEKYNSTYECIKKEGEDKADECERSFREEERSSP
ncbi:MAG TPA: hypothetical protein VF533_16805 [Solirubrobacteraceae bacterium]